MTNSRSYFYTNSSLNKGYQTIDNTTNDNSIGRSTDHRHFLEPKVLEVFESAHPGSVTKIIQIAEREQKHRHAYEISNLASYARSRMFGQIMSFISLFIIAYVSMNMVLNGNTNIAIMFSSLYFISVFAVSIFAYLCDRNQQHIASCKTKSLYKKHRQTERIPKGYETKTHHVK